MPNAFAYLMLMIWPVACVVMFRRMGIERAIIWSILGGYLLLPPRAVFDLPLVPDFNKTSIPNLCALACCLWVQIPVLGYTLAGIALAVLLLTCGFYVRPSAMKKGGAGGDELDAVERVGHVHV